jgi:hypothetical protein
MIIDGKFTKFIYSTNYFTMNCLYLLFPVKQWRIESYPNRVNVLCYANNTINKSIVQKILSLEADIIELYKEINHCKKRLSSILMDQLNSCSLKITKDFYSKTNVTSSVERKMVIKISGVWESTDEVGVTYKLTELYDASP